jgi:hypothetical protein
LECGGSQQQWKVHAGCKERYVLSSGILLVYVWCIVDCHFENYCPVYVGV